MTIRHEQVKVWEANDLWHRAIGDLADKPEYAKHCQALQTLPKAYFMRLFWEASDTEPWEPFLARVIRVVSILPPYCELSRPKRRVRRKERAKHRATRRK